MFGTTPAEAFACNLDLSKAKAKVVTATIATQTNSSASINVPGVAVTFTQGRAGCIFIQFVAEVATPNNETMTIRAVVDESGTGGTPDPVTFSSRAADQFAGNAANFIFTNVSAGSHTVRIKWNSFGAQIVKLRGRSLAVYYLP